MTLRPSTPPSTPFSLAATFAVFVALVVLAALDQTVVSTALPAIERDLHGAGHASWVFSAYLIASTVAVPLYGRLVDQWGSKPVLLAAVVLFMAGSLMCGVSSGMTELVVARGLQGAGGGGFMTLAMSAVPRMFDAQKRARLQGMLGATYGLSTMAGPVVGGVLVQYYSWRWAFLFNVPVALLALGVLAVAQPRMSHARAGKMDYPGALLLIAALVCIMFATSQIGEVGLGRTGFALAGIALTGAFIGVEARTRHPLIPLAPFAQRGFAAAVVLSVASGVTLFAIVVFVPLYFQSARLLTPAESGWHLMALTAGITFGSISSGRLLAGTGRVRRLAASACALIVGALTLLALGMNRPDMSVSAITALLVPLGIGLGILFPVVTVVAQNSVEPAMLGVATASPVMFRSVAGAVGTSVLGAVFAGALNPLNPGATPLLDAGSRAAQFGGALSLVLWISAGFALLAGCVTWVMPSRFTRRAESAGSAAHEHAANPGRPSMQV